MGVGDRLVATRDRCQPTRSPGRPSKPDDADAKLDKALKDSFPGSDPVSFVEAAPLKDVAEWAERYRAIWEGRLDRLDTYLKELQTKETKNARQRRRK